MKKIILSLCCFINCASSYENIVCPEYINEKPEVIGDYISWEPYSMAGKKYLDKIVLFSKMKDTTKDESQLLMELVPDNDEDYGNTLKSIWTFQANDLEEYYIGCKYHGTRALLTKKVNDKFTNCYAQYEELKIGNGEKIVEIKCSE